ncbi:uncharacterized protein LOC113231512 [Hyposmocoma kahamanoa]|uniref:uncharacterized protein LOC113231512 n=1 Tax=Hyposmocoma kahamanoa TaxID=1477025 RepID=UPI000E6D99CD|nr:uncharacterized protein LOC113231512 [Hyposmocoma kahamanoa]
MDKNTYETYEYLSANSESDTDQFFVVQDDGTFLINRQVQYVAQVQDVKEALDTAQPCTVYDVSSQQFFVDVDNSAEMISVPDNFILPVPAAEESSNLYGNSYLLQAVPDSTTDQVEVEDDQYKETETQEDIDVVNILNKTSVGCTEITITDEQYRMLEEKGWILLETNDKVFVLNTLGLHDITTNHDLIEQYRAENQTNAVIQEEPLTSIKMENLSTIKIEKMKIENSTHNTINQHDAVELVIDNSDLNGKENIAELPLELNNEHNMLDNKEQAESNVMAVDTKPDPQEVLKEPTTPTIVSPTVDVQRNNILRIKTKYCFKDIPNKIVLGKTVNGNNLVARVVKRSCNNYIRNSIPPDSSSNSTTIAKKARNIEIESPSSRSECQRQIEQTLPRNTQETEYVAAANEVIMQLLQIPAFQPSLTRHNVIITRAKTTKDGRNIPVNHSNTVTGSVEPIEGEDGRWKLVHKPNLLQQLHSELEQYMKDENASNDKTKTLEDFSVLHVHVAEKNENGTDSVSITLNKRRKWLYYYNCIKQHH